MSTQDDEAVGGGAVVGGARRYGGASADERRAQRRERLIDAGYAAFGRDGYLNTTMRLVCAQARLSERYFYESFESVEALFRAVHQREATRLARLIATRLATMPEADGVAMTRASLVLFFEWVKEDPRRARILLTDAVTTGATNPQFLGTRAAHYADLVRDRLLHKYPEMRQTLNVDYIVAGFGGLIVQVGSMWVEAKFDTPIENLVDHIIYAWRGLHVWLAEASATRRASQAG